ncbi:MAG: hypothetical protein AAGF77_06235 [Bacteroidota bacterium]
MLFIKRLFRFYVNASVHVAFSVAALYGLSVQRLNIIGNKSFLGFLILATIVCYNFVKYGVEAKKYWIVAKPAHRPIQWFSGVAFVGSAVLLWDLEARLWGYIILLTILSGLYAVPLLPNSRNLRSLGGLKIFLIALIWTGFTVWLPVVDGQLAVNDTIVLLCCQQFILVLTLLLPFEIRDLKYDAPELRTLPQRFGIAKTKRVGYLLVLGYLVLGSLGPYTYWLHLFADGLMAVLMFVGLYYTKEVQTRYYASFWIEGIPILVFAVQQLLIMVS